MDEEKKLGEGPFISQAELARFLGMHRGSVTRFKQAGRLVIKSGKVDLEASLRRLEETRDPNRDDVAARHAATRGQIPAPGSSGSSGDEGSGSSGETYQAARAKKERFLALQAELDYERAMGKLIDREAVVRSVADVVTTMRQALENRAHRLAPELVGQDLDAIRSALRVDTVEALTELEREFSRQIAEIAEEGR